MYVYSGTSLIRTPLGQTLFNKEVSLIQRLLSTQMWHLGQTHEEQARSIHV